MINRTRRALLSRVTIASFFLSISVGLFGSATANAAEHPAQELVQGTVAKLLELMGTEGDKLKSDRAYLQSKLDEYVVPHIDFEYMTRLTVGKNWKKANSAQQEELISEFQMFLLNTYTSAINEFRDGKVEYQKFQPDKKSEKRATVKSKFIQGGSSDVPLTYYLRDKGGWKIYNLKVGALDMVRNYRGTFTTEVKNNGIDGLIKLLKDKNAETQN